MEKNKRTAKSLVKFMIPSAIGVFLFMCPVPYNGSWNITIAIITSSITKLIGDYMPYVVYTVILVSAIGTIMYKTVKPKFMEETPFIKKLFDVNTVPFAIRIIAGIFTLMLIAHTGPEVIIGPDTGAFVVSEFLKSFITTIFFAGTLMTLLLDYGFMDFIGAFLARVFTKLFTLPGRSAIDCITSWLGDAVVAILITSDQYDKGYYNAREASVISTTFSAVSISFTLVILAQLGLDDMFFPFFYTTLAAGALCAIIMPRIPPLRNKSNTYLVEHPAQKMEKESKESILSYALDLACDRAEKANYSLYNFFKNGLNVLVSCGINTMPIVLFVGTVTLAFNFYTPLFTWLGYPFLPLLNLLQIPEAMDASACMLAGFGDNFVPSVVAASTIDNIMTRFIIGSISINQLIYMSQVGALILGSHIPVKFMDLFVIFIERTVLSLFIVTFIAKFIVF